VRYLFASFVREEPDTPRLSFHEVSEDDLETRKIEIFFDGSVSYCSSELSTHPDYYLSAYSVPSPELAMEAVAGCMAISGDPTTFDWLWNSVTGSMNRQSA
jgi:hypothetical protein